MKSRIVLVLLLACSASAQQPQPRPALVRRSKRNAPSAAESPAATSSSLSELVPWILFEGPVSYTKSWYNALLTVTGMLDDAVEDITDSTSRFVFKNMLGLRVGWGRLRRLALQFSRMALGWAMILNGGQSKWAQPLLFVQACQLVSFSLTTLRTLAGLGRIRLFLREAIVVAAAAASLRLPDAGTYLPAVVLGVHAGKSTRGFIRATRFTSEAQDGLGEAAVKQAEEAIDQLTDGIAATLGVDDWWDDEPTTSEAELARFQLIGRTLSPVVAAAVTAAVLTSSAPFGAAAVPMVAAACSGAFMFQRNVHQVLAENWLYLRLALLRAIPVILRSVVWLLWHVVYPLKKVILAILSLLGTVQRVLNEWLLMPLYRALVFLAPPLARVDFDVFKKHLLALPSLGKKLGKKTIAALSSLLRLIIPKGVHGFVAQLADKAEKYFLPYGFAALGVALQMTWVRLSDFPKLIGLLLNPTALMTQLVEPSIRAALANAREAWKIPQAAMGFFKA